MSQLNTIALRDALLTRVTDFALDDNFVRDSNLTEALRKIWSGRPEDGGLGSDLWVEGAFPSTPAAETMRQLVDRGLIHSDLGNQLNKTGVFPFEFLPHQHQLESIEAAASNDYPHGARPAVVVTAGTGAGKTESFLIPMLNDLWRADKSPQGGISALILYPMNALVNDQVGRLDKWLEGQSRVSSFHFTSDTPEDAKRANARNLPLATPARFRTRQQARGLEDLNGKRIPGGDGPTPSVLVTNYSMLEYMLCRPQDAVFFGQNLRVIVLDEAHIYSGNLAAEITFLLRRLLMRCGRRPEDVLCIATSATIGGGATELKSFAAKLFSKPEQLVKVVVGTPQKPQLNSNALPLPLPQTLVEGLNANSFPNEDTLSIQGGAQKFVSSTETSWRQWTSSLAAMVPPDVFQNAIAKFSQARQAAPLLEEALRHSGALVALQEVLWNDGVPIRIPLQELAQRLFHNTHQAAVEATRQMLQAGALARSSPAALPLVPNRVHYLMRGPEGILAAFGGQPADGMCALQNRNGLAIFSAGADPSAIGAGANHPLTLFRCNESGWWGVAASQVGVTLEPVPQSVVLYGQDEVQEADPENPTLPQPSRIRFYSLDAVPGCNCIYFNPSNAQFGGDGPVPLWVVTNCPISGVALAPESVGWFSARARLQLSVVAETALAAMPEYPDDSKAWKPARGRRLLVFSDSRAEAARLGPRLTRQHELQVFRAAVVERLTHVNLAGTAEDIAAIKVQITALKEQARTAKPIMQHAFQTAIEALETQLREMGEGGLVQQWAVELKNSELVRELYHAPDGKNHQPGADNAPDIWRGNSEQIRASLTHLLGRELARRPAWPTPSLETLGLVEVTYPGLSRIPAPAEILGNMPPSVASRLEAVWSDYLAALLDAVRNQGAITLGSSEEDRDYHYGNGFLGKRFSAECAYRSEMIPLIGVHFVGQQVSRRNAFTKGMLVLLGLQEEEATRMARELMRAAFEALLQFATAENVRWLRVFPNSPTNNDHAVPALQLCFLFLGLRRPSTLYRCSQTGQVWPRSVVGLFPGASKPVLVSMSHDEVDEDPRLLRRRDELRNWPGFKLGLWAEEHSAQLSPDENARLQNLFREGMRNILSSTTTLELGIDIGGLSAVLLGNLPPGKANYLQRAGRAGRRADGTSAVLGFARPTAYEREVFLDFRRYLQRELRRPTIFLDRAALAKRHAHAWLLGEFFRQQPVPNNAVGAMNAFGNMGAFTGQSYPQKWQNNQMKPQLDPPDSNPLSTRFLTYLDSLIQQPPEGITASLRRLWDGCANVDSDDHLWGANIQSVRDEFAAAISLWTGMVSELTATWQEIPDDAGFRAQANAIYYQSLVLRKLTVIESLADSRVLPRYGFPIGLSRLRVQVADREVPLREEDQFRLQRDSMMALREYAPGSQLLVGGQIITSRGLMKHWTGAVVQNESWGLRGRFVWHTSKGFFDYTLTAQEPNTPPNQGGNVRTGTFIFPKHGFTTAAWDPPRYGSDFEKVGNLKVFTLAFGNMAECDPPQLDFGGIQGCSAVYRSAGELLLLNFGAFENGFAICQNCGFAESEWTSGAGRVNLPKGFESHSPLNSAQYGVRCWAEGEAPVWRNHHLAAKQSTHLLRIDFSALGAQIDQKLIYTLGQALRLTAAQALELDEREIGAMDPTPDSNTGRYNVVILYDFLAGGSGHLAELSHRDNPKRACDWIERTIKILTVEGDMSEEVRRREVIRRLLTSACNDALLDPKSALEFLQRAVAGVVAPGPVAQPALAGVWTLERLVYEEPPPHFTLYVPANAAYGLAEGWHEFSRFQPRAPLPEQNKIALLREAGPPQQIHIGRWFYQRTDNLHRPHRLRLRPNFTKNLTEAEFNAISEQIVAIHTPAF